MGHKIEAGCGIREILRDNGRKYLSGIGMGSFRVKLKETRAR